VVNQTLRDIEIICINDGSSDNTEDILTLYATRNQSFVIINQENGGAARARNKGIDIAKGEYVAFLDSDDFYPDADTLECLYREAKENEVLICGGSLSMLIDGKIKNDAEQLGKYRAFICDRKMNFNEYRYAGGFTRFIYQTDFVRNNNIIFPSYSTYEDPPFFVRAMSLAKEFYGIEKVTYCYRKGYKSPRVCMDMALGYAKGILDVLTVSKDSGWNELYVDTIEELNSGINNVFYPFVTDESLELNHLLYQINAVIDKKLIPENNAFYQNPFLVEPQFILDRRAEYVSKLKCFEQIIIYGAGVVGRKVYHYLQKAGINNISYYAVSEKKDNPDEIYGVPVVEIKELISCKEDALILIATKDSTKAEMKVMLDSMKFRNVIAFEFI
jgi:glycosyltransferase involved in cell wall biosynthesis